MRNLDRPGPIQGELRRESISASLGFIVPVSLALHKRHETTLTGDSEGRSVVDSESKTDEGWR